jgi:hypothetical protein
MARRDDRPTILRPELRPDSAADSAPDGGEDRGRARDAACCEALAQVCEGCCGPWPATDTLAILQVLDPRALDAPPRPGPFARLAARLRGRADPSAAAR